MPEIHENILQALDRFGLGVAVYDDGLGLVAFNKSFAELGGFPAPLVRRGRHISELLRFNAERGDFGPGPADHLVRRQLGELTGTAQVASRRICSGDTEVEIRHLRTSGDGLVSIYSDARRGFHAEKAKLVGQFTGGLAHDFNNLLMIMQGNLELIREQMEPGSRFDEKLAAAIKASIRGSELVRRLLAYSRQQVLEAKTTDVGGLVVRLSTVIQRAVDPAVHVEIRPAAGLWPAVIDPGQLEDAILNLVINARDAMPDGGSLVIETCNVRVGPDLTARYPFLHGGEYAVISVSDSGAGIDPEVAPKVFEPFFTTKDVGRGSGLGLSMVYGFVKQSGGYITVESEAGKGTTVNLYLPRARNRDTAKRPAKLHAVAWP